MDTMNTMITKPLRSKINTMFSMSSLKLDRAVDRDQKLREIHFLDTNTGELRVGLRDHPYFLRLKNDDGREIVVPPCLHDMATQVREAMPFVQFYIEDTEYDYHLGSAVVSELNVYRPGDVLCMGRIAYGHTGMYSGRRVAYNNTRVNNYMVYSPFIENKKYRESSNAFFMRASKDLSAAVKTAKKYLRPLSPVDVAYAYKDVIQDKVSRKVQQFMYKANGHEYDLNRHTGDMAELIKDLIAKRVDRIHNSELEKLIHEYAESKKEFDLEANKPHRFTFVLVRHDGTVSTLEFGANKISDGVSCTSTEVSTYYSADEIPEEVQSAVATISVLEDKDFVEGLGMKLNDSVYWIHHEDQ